jgi:hypothetical protein
VASISVSETRRFLPLDFGLFSDACSSVPVISSIPLRAFSDSSSLSDAGGLDNEELELEGELG